MDIYSGDLPLHPREYWQCMEAFLVILCVGGWKVGDRMVVLLASSEWRSGMLLSILGYTGQTYNKEWQGPKCP